MALAQGKGGDMTRKELVDRAAAKTLDALLERYRGRDDRDEVPITEVLRAMAAFFELIGDKALQWEMETLASQDEGV